MIVLLNGPPGSGKDTAAKFIVKHLARTVHYKLSRPLKSAVNSIFDISPEVVKHFDAEKEVSSPHLLGSTYREAQISVYHMLSAKYGENVLARLFIRYLKKYDASKHIVVSDCGRTGEAQTLIAHFGNDNVSRIKLYRSGCNFDDDIREYVKINLERDTAIDNKFDLHIFEMQVKRVLTRWRLIDGDN